MEGTDYDFRQPKRIGSIKLDHAFTNLERDADGLARVELRDSDRETKASLWVDQSYPYLMLFSGDPLPNIRRRSLAVEPMTCPPNAFRTGDALIRLEPAPRSRVHGASLAEAQRPDRGKDGLPAEVCSARSVHFPG